MEPWQDKKKKKNYIKTKQLYMASQQANRSTTSQVVEARELKILYEQEIATRAAC